MDTKKKLTKRGRPKTAVVEQLEPRILFSADLLSTNLDTEGKSEPSVPNNIEWDSLVNDPAALAGAYVKNNPAEHNERSTSLKATAATSDSGQPNAGPPNSEPPNTGQPNTDLEESTAQIDLLSDTQRQTQQIVEQISESALPANDKNNVHSSDATSALTPTPNPPGSGVDENNVFDETSDAEFDKIERTELVFIDGSVDDSDQLLAELQNDDSPGTDWIIVELDKTLNGIDEITETLEGVTNIDAIHIISHGDGESIQLGTEKLTAENFEQYSNAINAWSETFTSEGDLLIYGCDLASTDEGKSLLSDLAASCDCDVAASDDTTGHESLEACLLYTSPSPRD